jgi:epoxyqueuosine reductase
VATPAPPDPGATAARIKATARQLGFEAVGIASARDLDASSRYEAWLSAGFHGEMAYLATDRHRERRADVERVLPGARSIVCVALACPPQIDAVRDERLGKIARYAAGEDYHRVMRDSLRALEATIQSEIPGVSTLGYSDTGAILERAWAERAGLGWIGKNTCLISPTLGSWLLLGEILTDAELPADPAFDRHHCGTCRRCIDECPTGAIVGPQRLDARRCISYLTIELRGPIPLELRPLVGEWIFGCDICQDVCPWNRFAPPAREARLHARTLEGWSLERFLTLDDAGFTAMFATSPIRRARRSGFLRNVCVALGNRGEPSAMPTLIGALRDHEPLVRGHAAWALGEIARRTPKEAGPVVRELERVAAEDPDESVQAEAKIAVRRAAGIGV